MQPNLRAEVQHLIIRHELGLVFTLPTLKGMKVWWRLDCQLDRSSHFINRVQNGAGYHKQSPWQSRLLSRSRGSVALLLRRNTYITSESTPAGSPLGFTPSFFPCDAGHPHVCWECPFLTLISVFSCLMFPGLMLSVLFLLFASVCLSVPWSQHSYFAPEHNAPALWVCVCLCVYAQLEVLSGYLPKDLCWICLRVEELVVHQ